MGYRKDRLLRRSLVFFICLVSIYALLNIYTSNNAERPNIFIETQLEMAYREWQKIAPNPWLFPHHPSKVLFSGIHNNLDLLLARMSKNTNKIALVRYNYPWQMMLQNQIYTLAKFGRVFNYIVMVGDEKSLQVCFELNLPCFNGTKYFKDYYKDIDPTVDALFTDKKHYKPLNWFKLRFYLDVLIRNYTILAFDTDIAFGRKKIWLSFEKYSADVGHCDMIFMREAPVNAGFFYSRSNPDTIALFKEWVNTEYTHSHLDEQRSFGALRGYYYEICTTKQECDIIKERKMIALNQNSTKMAEGNLVSIRRFSAAYSILGTGVCPAKRKVDPCHSASIFVHPICTVGQKVKIKKLKLNGFWLLQDPCNKTSTSFSTNNNGSNVMDVYRCKPTVFADPLAEKDFEKCSNDIAWTK